MSVWSQTKIMRLPAQYAAGLHTPIWWSQIGTFMDAVMVVVYLLQSDPIAGEQNK